MKKLDLNRSRNIDQNILNKQSSRSFSHEFGVRLQLETIGEGLIKDNYNTEMPFKLHQEKAGTFTSGTMATTTMATGTMVSGTMATNSIKTI